MKQIFLLISLFFAHQAFAVCSSPIARTNFSANQVLTSTRLNADLNAAYTRANELPGDCITSESVTTTQIDDGTIANADISASAAIDIAKTTHVYSVALLKDLKANGVESGTFTGSSWATRDLNDETDPDGIVTLSSNQFTLNAGTYIIEGSAPAYYVNDHMTRIANLTDSTVTLGSSENATAAAGGSATSSRFYGLVVITSAKVFAIQHICNTSKATNGFGYKDAAGGSGSIFTMVKITKIK